MQKKKDITKSQIITENFSNDNIYKTDSKYKITKNKVFENKHEEALLIMDHYKSFDKCIVIYIFGLIYSTILFKNPVSFYSLALLIIYTLIFAVVLLIIKTYKSKVPADDQADLYLILRFILLIIRHFCVRLLSNNDEFLSCSFVTPYFFQSVLVNKLFYIDFMTSNIILMIEAVLLLPLFGNFESFVIIRIVSYNSYLN